MHKNYSDYSDSFFISPTNKEEIKFIISSLDINKSNGPYSIPNKVLKMLDNKIPEQLVILFHLSFTIGTFPTILKTAKAGFELHVPRSQNVIIFPL